MATAIALLILIPREHEQPKLLTIVRGRTGAYLHGPDDCGARARSRLSFNRTIAVSLSMQSLSTFVCACDGVLPVALG